MPSKSALVILADGAEEMEAVISVDVLRRGQVDVTVAGLNGDTQPVVCSRNVKILADVSLDAVQDKEFDAVVLPGGGPGAKALAASAVVGNILSAQYKRGGVVAAICAAPTALKAHEIAKGKKITSYPAFKDALKDDYDYQEERVVVDGTVVTSRGPGTCFEFALKLVEILVGKEVADPMPRQMVLN